MFNSTPLGASSVVATQDAPWMPFPIPGASGDISAALLNLDLTQGPVVAAMKMAPGARIPEHFHKTSTETIYVVEGEFVNHGKSYAPGDFLAIRPGDLHGPHEAPRGCTILFMQSTQVDPSDFFIDPNDPAFVPQEDA